MKRICPCFTPFWIALTDSAWETVSLPRLGTLSTRLFLSRARDCTTFTLQDSTDFYIERVTAHRIKRNDHSCFHNCWPNSKTKLKLKHLWEQGGPWCFGALCSLRILRIGRIGSGCQDIPMRISWLKQKRASHTVCVKAILHSLITLFHYRTARKLYKQQKALELAKAYNIIYD